MKKKILSALLAAAMVLTSCLPVFAEGEVQPQPIPETPAIVNEEPKEFCECGLVKDHEGECQKAAEELCECGLAKGHEGECQKAAEELCECGLAKDHEGECQKAAEELCECGLAKGHEGDCQKAAEELCECGLAKDHEGDCQKAAEAPVAPAFDAVSVREQILASTSEEEVEEICAALTEDQQQAVLGLFTEEEIYNLAKKLNVDIEEEIITPAVNYTEVGPLLPAVTVPSTFFRLMSPKTQDDNGLVLNKTAEKTSEGYKITLEAYTKGKVVTSTTSVPVDIVMVLDESGSMAHPINQYTKVYKLNERNSYYVKSEYGYIRVSWCGGGFFQTHDGGWYTGGHFGIHWGSRYEPMTSETDTTSGRVQFYQASASSTSKREALIAAATGFANDVYNDAVTNNVDHRISVIGFSNDNVSEIKVGLVDDIRNNRGTVVEKIDGLSADGGTYIEDGLSNAVSAFQNAAPTTATQRKRVVVVFTDGIPGTGTWYQSMGSANEAIASANTLKNDYGATLYSIGMLDDANPELEISAESDDASRTNKFLHYLSSNYPNATSMDNGGTGSNKGYYLSASDTESLNAIFSKIAEELVTPSISLGISAVIKDVVSDYFNMPDDPSDIKVYTAAANADGTFAARTEFGLTPTVSGNQVSVSGFNFDDNCVTAEKKSDGTYGKKLIIEFTVTSKEGFLGGNNVPTNGEASGVYENASALTPIKYFEVPTVNVPIPDVTVTAEEKNVYLLGDLTADQLKAGATVKVGNVPLNLKANNFGLETWQKEFVDIEVKTAVNSKFNGKADSDYTITATVSPLYEALETSKGTPATRKEKSTTQKIYVFKPEITFKDSQINLGETANYGDNFGSVVWKHTDSQQIETLAKDVTMTGTEPELVYTYAPTYGPQEDDFKVDTSVKVSVAIGGTDVTTDHVTFYRDVCSFGCKHEKKINVGATDNERINFIVHIKSFDLTITKKVEGNVYDDGDTFLFTVTGPNNFEMEVVIPKSGSVTIKGLPVGTYTVTEDTAWSWRYILVGENGIGENGIQVEPKDVKDGVAKVTFTNKLQRNNWLSGTSYADNIFTGSSSQVTEQK